MKKLSKELKFIDATPDGKFRTFSSVSHGRIADKIYDNSKGSSFDKVLIRPGFDVPQNILQEGDLQKMFHKEVQIYHDFGRFMKKEELIK